MEQKKNPEKFEKKPEKEVLGPEDFLKGKEKRSVEEWGYCGIEISADKTEKAKKKPNKKLIAIALIVVIILLLSALAVALLSNLKSKQDKQQSTGEMTRAVTVQVNGVVETIKYAEVPECVGLKLDEAVSLLNDSFSEKPVIVYEESDKPNGTVTYQSIESGKSVPDISILTLFVSQGKAVSQNSSEDTASKNIPLKRVNMSPNKITLEPGETKYITTSIEPSNATNANFFLTSSDENVAVISGTNVITSIGVGKAKIIAMNSKGEELGYMNINVVAPETKAITQIKQTNVNPVVNPTNSSKKESEYNPPVTTYTSPVTEYNPPITTQKVKPTVAVYIVNFDANGGSTSTGSIRVESGETVNMPLPQRDYYQFDGWYTAENGGVHYTNSTPITSNITLYAHWTENPESAWVLEEDVPSNAIITGTKTQYRYQDKEYKKGQSSSEIPGWTLYNKNTLWGAEKTSRSVVSSTTTRKVWTTTETETKYKTVYWYKRYVYKNTSNNLWYYSYGESWAIAHGYSGRWEYKSSETELAKNGTVEGVQKYKDSSGGIWYAADCNKKQGLDHTTYAVKTPYSSQYTLYHYQDAYYTYDFYRWGSWSDWSDTAVYQSDSRNVQTREMCKYRNK
ncbi:MAG: InlB B-repeat-containing protein [Acutalibacteraceae bacterium]